MADVEGKTKEMDEEEVDADGWPKSLQHRKDGSCRSWLAVLGAALAQFVAVGSFYTIGMFVVPFMNAFDCGRGLAAATGSFSAIGFLTWSPFAGRFGDRYGSRRAILIGGSTATFFYFLASFSESIYAIWILYGIGVGFGCSTMYAPSAAIPANWFVKKRGLATGLAVAGGALGNVIFPLILSPILTSFGWAWALRIMGILTLVSCILSYFLIERRFPLITDGSPVIKLDLGLLKKRPGLLRLAFTYGAFQFGFFAPLLHLPAYTELDAGGTGLGLPASATVLSFMGLGNFIGRFALGVLADKAGPIATGTFANVMVAIATFFWPMYNDLAILSAYGFFYGLFGSAFWSLVPVATVRILTTEAKHLTGAIGIVLGPLMVPGCLTAAPLAGFLRETYGNYWFAAIITGIVFLITALINSSIKYPNGNGIFNRDDGSLIWEKRKTKEENDAELSTI